MTADNKMNSFISMTIVSFLVLNSLMVLVPFFVSDRADGLATSPVKWIKYANNPVITGNGWDSMALQTGCVLYENGTYKLYYMGGAIAYTGESIGYATSTDGVSWTKDANNPIFTAGSAGTWESTYVGAPCVINDSGTYKMWYCAYDSSNWRIGYATSSDGIAWTRYSNNPVLDLGAANSWDSNVVSEPFVIKENGIYRMWYVGNNGILQEIGYADSTDGINWTKSASNPVLKVGAAGSWESFGLDKFCVLNVTGTLRMWYRAYDGYNGRIGYATSTDGISWTKYSYNPIMSGIPNTWERHDNMDPVVYFNGSGYQMWYVGVDDSSDPWVFKIGYAEGWNTAPDAPSLTAPADSVWSNNNLPTFSWTFSDSNSQDSQTDYQLQLADNKKFNPLDIDTGKVSSGSTSFSPSAALSDGTYYWRAKVWDSDDDSSGWSSVRTVKIDTVPPTNPIQILSTSHSLNVWSNDNTIDVKFSGASDSLSGLDGYSYLWDYSDSTAPDTSKDIEETVSTSTSPAMSDSDSIYFHVRAIDNAGNIATSAAQLGPFWVDSTPPTNPSVASDTHLVNVWTNLTIAHVTWSGADGSISGVNGYSVVWDNNAATIPDTVKELDSQNSDAVSPGLTDGSWYFHIRTRDEAGNWAIDSTNFGPLNIDATPPSNPLNLVSTSHSTGKWYSDNTIDVSWPGGANGAVSGVSGYSCLWDNEPVSIPDDIVDCDASKTSETSPPLADGAAHYFHIRTRDNAGNWNLGASHLGPFWIDSTPPANPVSVLSQSHQVRKWSNNSNMEVNWSLPANGGMLSGYDGFSVVWDTSAFTLPDTIVDLDTSQDSMVSPPLPDGNTIYFHIRARDRAGNWAPGAVHLGPFWIDTAPSENPTSVVSTSHEVREWSSDNTIDITWSGEGDSLSGIDGYSYLWDHSASTVPPATENATNLVSGCTSPPLADCKNWYFHMRTVDRTGNWAKDAVHLGPFYIDTTPPEIQNFTINDNAELTNNSLVWLHLLASDTDPGSGRSELRLSLDGSSWMNWQSYNDSLFLNLTGADGPRRVYVQVRDNVHNAGDVLYKEILLDTHPPDSVTLSINDGAPFTNKREVELAICASDDSPGSGLSKMALSSNGTDWMGWMDFCTTRTFMLLPADGVQSVYLKVMDSAGNIGLTAQDDIFVDTVPPVASSLAIQDGSPFSTSLQVSLRFCATDAQPSSGISQVCFSQDNLTWGEWLPYAGQVDYTLSPGDGGRQVFFKVRDHAMNEGGPLGDDILVDTSFPAVRTVLVSGIYPGGATVTWYTSKPTDSVLEYGPLSQPRLRVHDSAFRTVHDFTLKGLETATQYSFQVSGTDVHGNGPVYGENLTFTTASAPGRKAPVVSGVSVEQVTDSQAVISWYTDVPADSLIEYGTTRALGSLDSDHSFVYFHRVFLCGLVQDTNYYFVVKSADVNGNGPGRSGMMTIRTRLAGDTPRLVISDVTVAQLTATLALISWTTNGYASCTVDFGTGIPYSGSIADDGYSINHSAVLSGLLPGTTYYFRVRGNDICGNVSSTAAGMTFTTPLAGSISPPVISSVKVLAIGKYNATIEVVLDEPADLFVDVGTNQTLHRFQAPDGFSDVHRFTIGGLRPGNKYHFSLLAVDAGGNIQTGGSDKTFQTRGSPAGSVNSMTIGDAGLIVLVVIVVAALAFTGGMIHYARRSRRN